MNHKEYMSETLHHAQVLLEELTLLIESGGQGTKRISRHLEQILHMRIFDSRMDEIRYQVSTDHLDDAISGMEHLTNTISDKF